MRFADNAFDRFASRFNGVFIDEPAQSMMLGADVEQRGDRFARTGRPLRKVIDVEQLTIAARNPIVSRRGENRIELRRRETGDGSNLLPLSETIARCKAPAHRAEIIPGERKRESRRSAQDSQLRFRCVLAHRLVSDVKLRRDLLNHIVASATKCRTKQHQLLGPGI